MIPTPTPRPDQPTAFNSGVVTTLGTPTNIVMGPVTVTSTTATTLPMAYSTYEITIPAPPYPWGLIIALVLVIAWVWGFGAVLLVSIGERRGDGVSRKVWIWPLLPLFPRYWRHGA